MEMIWIDTVVLFDSNDKMWYLSSASFQMGQLFKMEIWPLLTITEVNIRVTYVQKENFAISWYITGKVISDITIKNSGKGI